MHHFWWVIQEKQLDLRFGDDFRAELQECLTGCVSKGFEHMYGYMGADGVTHFMAADSLGVVEVRALNDAPFLVGHSGINALIITVVL